MSAIDTATTATLQRSTGQGYGDLTSQEFLRVIFTELTNQDPLAPSETKDLLQQIATIRSIESDLSLGEKLEAIVKQNQLASAGALIGQFVIGRTAQNDPVADLVGSVSVTKDGPVLNLVSGFSIPMDRVEEIINPALLQGAAGA